MRAVARSGEERRGEKKMTLEFQENGSHAVGLNEAQAGGEKADPSLRCFNFRAAGWVTCHFLFWAGLKLVVWA
jgi:hypothetical protein